MMFRSRALGLMSPLLLLVTPAFAEEESDKVKKARYETELEKEADGVNEKCGLKLDTEIDWASFDADPRWKDKSVSGYCDAPFGVLRSYCEGKNAQAYIQKNVKKIVCRAVKEKGQWKVVVKGGVIEWQVPPEAVNADEFARQQLLRNL